MLNKSIEKWAHETKSGQRFQFGTNWKTYAPLINSERINIAEKSLSEFLGDISGKTFLDIGSGSGLSSLAARNLNARVCAFDYDENSVECTMEVKKTYYPNDPDWKILQGSILDEDFLNTLGQFDIVYSWGVLHHTGDMWNAIYNAMKLTKKDGLFFIAIYNKQKWKSYFWWHVKYIFNKLPNFMKKAYALILGFAFQMLNIIKYTVMLKPQVAIKPLLTYANNRGMSIKHDIIDWIGGFPYEYATIDELNTFFKRHNFIKVKEVKTQSLGCNQIVYKRTSKCVE
jgi:2-polyprenyl-6-hydroxyphenyl methylase/3-demethylubiquinone-9 3-methyltransferase